MTETEVTRIDRKNKTVFYRNLSSQGQQGEGSFKYDKLILSVGAQVSLFASPLLILSEIF